MLSEDCKSENINLIVKELFSSIKEINRRIDELKLVNKQPFCGEEMKKYIRERIARLYDTKFCLIYSIYDLRENIVKSLSDSDGDIRRVDAVFSVENLYKGLKNL